MAPLSWPASALDNSSPIINGMRYSGEILWIICRDVWSLKKPTTNIAQNTNPWEGAILDVIQVNRLPRLRKAAMFIAGEPEDPEVVMHRLQVQNNAKNWLSLNEVNHLFSVSIGVGIKTETSLNERIDRINYKVSSLAVKLQKPSGKVQKTTPVAPDSMIMLIFWTPLWQLCPQVSKTIAGRPGTDVCR